jgi:hypothetical protein
LVTFSKRTSAGLSRAACVPDSSTAVAVTTT